jgi:hypothetical protein
MRKPTVVLVWCLMFLSAGVSVVGEKKVLARVGEEVLTIEEFLMLAPMATTMSPRETSRRARKLLKPYSINSSMLTRRSDSASMRVPEGRGSGDKPERTS